MGEGHLQRQETVGNSNEFNNAVDSIGSWKNNMIGFADVE